MANFSPAFIDALLEHCDLVRLIDSRVPLKKKGRDFWACCPFHQEKSPSFSVSADKQIYYCFGCHAHGNAIGFLMAHDRLSFPEAVKTLADEVGVALPEDGPAGEQESLRPLRAILEKAIGVYRSALAEHPPAQEYLRGRGLSEEIIGRFELGYAPSAAGFLSQKLGREPSLRQQLLGAGLVSGREDGSVYDRFRGRVIFPIRDGRGQAVGLGGRSLDGHEPKYLNSPESALYHKGRVLYGLHQAREGMRRAGRVLLVEGYLDVITLHQAGIDYAVAASGTALGDSQMEMLFRAAHEVLLCFDGDTAGRNAAWRAVQTAPEHLRAGRLLRLLFLPDGQDPDSLVREQGGAVFESMLPTARPAIDFFLEELQRRHNLAAEDEKALFLHAARDFLKRVSDPVLREVYEQRVQTLCGLAPVARRATSRAPRKATFSAAGGRSLFKTALRLLLNFPEDPAWQALDRDLLPFLFDRDPMAEILAEALDILANMTHLSSHELFAKLSVLKHAEACYALVMSDSGDEEGQVLMRLEISGCVARVNQRLAAARSHFISRAADQGGLSALSEQERAEVVRLSRRDRRNGVGSE
ncbi:MULTISPECIES: DNA primase [Acidithiobacillus]|jgi:DNA primase|uniref:DNA primase n=2 Tax=Acidithiobacillus ferrooxidans TaxID=920 RepID=B7J6A4_ACIF2|nr:MULTISPECIES: DNA primase [Acidithiobacillus]ACH84188.1 DNA primase [Acidithiobacillus ferrooxidans ATCC 53993]ACK80843.1 DNA primase [Acidithiobacillus ferrooxidans ATCC 23270]MBN6743626.1 DNA primase [Acidithiobacillus sp. MC2.2]MBN6747101.1 DNA primase [Acidithiobacillus sp. PG05]MBU2773131.1 DNA primase [Acidithiobacillus ferrooxidans]